MLAALLHCLCWFFLLRAPQLFLGIIGEKWIPAAIALSLFTTLVGMGKAIVLLVGPLLQALSKPGIHSFNTWAFAAVNGCGVWIVAYVVGDAPPGTQAAGIALMRSLIFCVGFMPLLLWQARRVADLSFTSVLLNLRGVLAAGLTTAGAITLIDRLGLYRSIQVDIVSLIIVICIATVVWFGSLRIFDQAGFELMWLETTRLWDYIAKLIRLRRKGLS